MADALRPELASEPPAASEQAAPPSQTDEAHTELAEARPGRAEEAVLVETRAEPAADETEAPVRDRVTVPDRPAHHGAERSNVAPTEAPLASTLVMPTSLETEPDADRTPDAKPAILPPPDAEHAPEAREAAAEHETEREREPQREAAAEREAEREPEPEREAAAERETEREREAEPERELVTATSGAQEDTGEHDPLSTSMSLSSEFFREDDASVPPVIDELDDPVKVEPPSPETLAWRARLRRVVGAIVAVAALCAAAVVGKAITSRGSTGSIPAPPAPVPAMTEQLGAELPTKVAQAPVQPASAQIDAKAAADPDLSKAEEAKPAEEAQAEEAKPEEAKPAEEAKAEEAKPEEAKPAEEAKALEAPSDAKPDAAKAAELKKETLKLLDRGKPKDAIPMARAAIEADPTDALSYLYLGSAFQDIGKWKDAHEAYSACVRNAKKGPIHECHALGGRK